MTKDSKQQLSLPTIILHWLIAVVFIYLLITEMSQPNLHKSLGSIVLIFVLIRIIWRLQNGWLQPVCRYKKREHQLAKATHWILIIGTLLLPITGLFISIAGGHGLSIFGLNVVAENIDPINTHNRLALNQSLANVGNFSHKILANIMVITVLLHIAGALKHHFIDRDKTLSRMLGKFTNKI